MSRKEMKNRTNNPEQRGTERTNRRRPDATRTTAQADTAEAVRDLLSTSGPKPITTRMTKPSGAAMERYCAVPLMYDVTSAAPPVQGEIVLDSWAHGSAIGLRDVIDGHVRRLKLKAGRLTLEIVAQRRDNRWEFVARATAGRRVANRFVLKVGGRKLLPQSGGFYIWASASVPHKLRLESFEDHVIFENLAWR